MIGLLGAIAGGAMKGYGAGQMEEIKQQREAKLKELDRQFTKEENALSRAVQEKQIASSERQSSAQLAVSERIANNQQATNRYLGELSERGATNRTELQVGSAEKIARDQIAASKDIEEFRAASDQLLNTKMIPVRDASGKETYKVVTPDGHEIPKLKGPDGKELDWAGADADTDAAKNYKFMIANDFDPVKAGQLAFGAKDSDIDSMTAQFYDSFVKSSFTTPDETKSQQFLKMARDAAVSIANRGTATAAPATGTDPAAAAPAAAGTPAAASPATEPDYSAIPRPTGMSDAQIIETVKADPKLRTKPPAMVKRLLQAWGVSEDAIRKGGL
jgi:hypothetical protein